MSPRKVGVVDADTHLTLVLAAILLVTQIPSLTSAMDDLVTERIKPLRCPQYVVTAFQARPVTEEFAKTSSGSQSLMNPRWSGRPTSMAKLRRTRRLSCLRSGVAMKSIGVQRPIKTGLRF
jgi:hypothetical protein